MKQPNFNKNMATDVSRVAACAIGELLSHFQAARLHFLKNFPQPVAAPRGGDWGDLSPPNPNSRQKLSKKNGIKLVGYTFRL